MSQPNNVQTDITQNFGSRYEAILPTLGEELARILKYFGVKRGYGVGGDYAANILRALESEVPLYPSSNEMHAGFTACGDAEINGIGFCFVTYTVGSMPVISAAALAKTEQLPVIFISGAPGEGEVVKQVPLHHVVHASNSWNLNFNAAINAFRALGIRSERLQGQRNPGQPAIGSHLLFELIQHAFEHKEPVFIEIPRDIIFQKVQPVQFPENSTLKSAAHLNRHFYFTKGAEFIAEEILEKLKNSKNPIVFFGERVRLNADLSSEILKFCEKNKIPFIYNLFAKGILSDFHKLNKGMYNGIFGSKDALQYVEQEADYVLEVATSIQTHDTSSAFATGTYRISSFSNKTLLKGTEPNVSDVLSVFKILNNKDIPSFFNSNLKRLPVHKTLATDAVHFRNIANTLNEVQEKTTQAFIYLPEVGNSFFSSFSLKTKRSDILRSWITNPWYAAMGTSIPYLRAVCEELKSRGSKDLPIVLTGDGGFLFQFNELIHLQKGKHYAVILLFRNNLYGLGKVSDNAVYYCNDQNFDVESLSKSFQASYYLVQNVLGLQTQLNQIIETGKGLHIFEIKLGNSQSEQSFEIELLNLYIQAKSGIPEAQLKWNALISSAEG